MPTASLQPEWVWPLEMLPSSAQQPKHKCDSETLRPTTRFQTDELENAIRAMEAILRAQESPRSLSGASETSADIAHDLGPSVDSETMNIVPMPMEDLTYSQFRSTLARGVPLQITGVHRRLQGQWTPEEFTDSMDEQVVKCIDCNSHEEASTKLRARDFFDLLSRASEEGQVVYKIKVSFIPSQPEAR